MEIDEKEHAGGLMSDFPGMNLVLLKVACVLRIILL